MLWRKGRNAFVGKAFLRHAEGIPDGKNTGVKYADNIAGIGFLQDFPFAGHDLLGLGKAHYLTALHMLYFHAGLKLAGAYTHERDSVTVGFIHIGLDFKYKGGKIIFHRIDKSRIRPSGERGGGHFQEML